MPKLKHVLIIWIVVYALITALIYLTNPWLVPHPVYIRTLILSVIMVFGLQYLVFPLLAKFELIK